MKTIGVAFIGGGIVAEMHGRGVAANPSARLIGVYDPRRSRARAIAGKFGGRAYRSLDELLSDPAVEAVHVLSPTGCHVPHALAALEAGKHVLIEKPVVENREDIRRLAEASVRTGLVAMPAHNYIYVPSLQRARRLIRQGKLGSISSLWVLYNIYHPPKVAALYGGVLREVCIHHAYSVLYLIGRPVRVSATLSQLGCEGPHENQAMITCQMPGGAVANLWSSFAADDPTSDPWTVVYKVLGTKGGVSYSWNEAQFQDRGGPAWGLPCYEDGFVGESRHFVELCRGRGGEPLSTLHDTADALSIIEAAERSAAEAKVITVEYDTVKH
jgi:predicted dehydrogenase